MFVFGGGGLQLLMPSDGRVVGRLAEHGDLLWQRIHVQKRCSSRKDLEAKGIFQTLVPNDPRSGPDGPGSEDQLRENLGQREEQTLRIPVVRPEPFKPEPCQDPYWSGDDTADFHQLLWPVGKNRCLGRVG